MEHFDFIVAGGGLSGVAAAAAAAREGLRVLLLEKTGTLGGAMSNALVYPFMPFTVKNPETGKVGTLSAGLFREMLERQDQYEPAQNRCSFRSEFFKLVLDDITEAYGVTVLFHAYVCGLTVKERRVESVQVATGSGVRNFTADFFADTTGDGNLFTMAGCEYQVGRTEDGLCQPMTLCFRMSGVDLDAFYSRDCARLQELYKQYRAEGKILNPRENLLFFRGLGDGILHFNTTRIVRLDPTDPFDVSRAEVAARKQVAEVVRFLRENAESFRNSSLVSVATEIGIRESRMLRGVYVLTAEELLNCTPFSDSIALGNYDIDIHNPNGTGTVIQSLKPGTYYRIPYRCLLPKEYDNLIVAGRCISATHEAQASVRIMPICCCMGEAAGTAVGIAYRTGANVHTVDVASVRERLLACGAAVDTPV